MDIFEFIGGGLNGTIRIVATSYNQMLESVLSEIKKAKESAEEQRKRIRQRSIDSLYSKIDLIGEYGRTLRLEDARFLERWERELPFEHRTYKSYHNRDNGKYYVLMVSEFVYEKDRWIKEFDNFEEYDAWMNPTVKRLTPEQYNFK